MQFVDKALWIKKKGGGRTAAPEGWAARRAWDGTGSQPGRLSEIADRLSRYVP
jgi:hypothetical protein